MLLENKFYDVIEQFDFLTRVKIYCLYRNPNHNNQIEAEVDEDTPDFEGYIDDIPYRFIDSHKYELCTEQDIKEYTDGDWSSPISIGAKRNEYGVTITYLEVYLINVREGNKE